VSQKNFNVFCDTVMVNAHTLVRHSLCYIQFCVVAASMLLTFVMQWLMPLHTAYALSSAEISGEVTTRLQC
jgi:hypothetical protein